MAKTRIPIPLDISADVLFLSDRTCCVCNDRGRAVQIHHLDEDPSNNNRDNLVTLCLLCHDDTQIKGGFGRKLSEEVLRKCREEWHAALRTRRDAAAGLIAEINPPAPPSIQSFTQEELSNQSHLIAYLLILPQLRSEAYRLAQPKWDSGITPEMKEGFYDVIDIMERVLVTLTGWYPQGQFDQQEPRDFINSLVASRFGWHHFHNEPLGHGTGGTIVGVEVAAFVLNEVEEMVAEMVYALCMCLSEPDFEEWMKRWTHADTNKND